MTENHDFSSLAHAAVLASLQRMVLGGLGSTQSQNETFSELNRHMQTVIAAPPIIREEEDNIDANEQENTEALEKIVTILKRQEALYRDNAFNPLTNDRDDYDIGVIITVLTKSERFMDKIVFQHLLSREPARQLLALKILCLTATHLHRDIVTNDSIYDFLVKKIKDSTGEMQSHAAFLLAYIITERDPTEKALNIERLPRILLNRLASLVEELMQGDQMSISVDNQGVQTSVKSEDGVVEAITSVKRKLTEDPTSSGQAGSEPTTPAAKRFKQTARRSASHGNQSAQWIAPPPLSLSHVSWAELDEITMELIYIMTALTIFAESQEISSAIFEENILSTILYLLSGAVPKPNKFLLNETLRLLCALLTHRKFASELVHKGGVQSLLRVPKTTYLSESVAACFLGLANLGTVMSIICLLPVGVLHELVKYSLYLIRGSSGGNNVVGGKHGAVFLSLIFSFRTMLDIFDKLDGLRSLVNLITVLYPSGQSFTGIDIEDRQTLRNACLALRQYFRMHLTILAAEVRNRIAVKAYGNGALSSTKDPPYKMTAIDYNTIVEDVKLIEDNYLIAFPLLSSSSIDEPSTTIRWKPVQKFMHLDVTPVLLKLIDSSTKWKMPDMCLYCMEIFHITTLCPGTHLTIVGREPEEGKAEGLAQNNLAYDSVPEGDESLVDEREAISNTQISQFIVSNDGMGYIIDAANGKLHNDSEVRKSALEVLCNLVRRQFYFPSFSKNILVSPIKAKHPKGNIKELHSDIIARTMWQTVREHNGILMLIRNLGGKGIPIVHQDDVRLLSTKCLVGLAGDSAIRNILTKLKIYRYLADMIREPKLEEKALSHKQFCQFALELIRCTTSKNVVLPPAITDEVTDATLSRIERAAVVQSTEITFSDQELLLVIYRHLQSKGLVQSAEALAKESRLSLDHPGSLNAGSASISTLNTSPSRIKTRRASKPSSPHTLRKATTTPARSRSISDVPVTSISPTSGLPSKSPFKITPRKTIINLRSESLNYPILSIPSPFKKSTQSPELLNQSQPFLSSSSTDRANYATLDRIVTEYLKHQHSHCHNPTSVLPPISLLESHYCPEAKLSSLCDAPKNPARRFLSRQMDGNHGGARGRKLDKAMVFRNFKPVKSYRPTQPYEDDETIPTCASFYKHGERILIGDHLGSIFQFNTETAEEYESFTLTDRPIWSLKVAPDDTLLLISSPLGGSALWNFETMIDPVATFAREKFALFNSTGSMIVGTSDDSAARLYDLTTSQPILTLNDSLSNNYRENNVAIFNLSDDQVLNNGILWDIRSQTKIHKFDRLTNYSLPAFNPNGHDLIINNLIWDVRTFKLLRTCSNLDKALIKFNSTGDVIYGIMQDGEYRNKTEGWRQSFGSVFRTFDADDYSTIATIECERKIFDLCVEETDNYIACVENGAQLNPSDTAVKLYAVGRKRLIPDDSDSESEDEEEYPDSGNDEIDDEDDDDYPYNDEEVEEVEPFGDAEYSDDGESESDSDSDIDLTDTYEDEHGNMIIFGESQSSDGEDTTWTGDPVDDDDDGEWETEEDDDEDEEDE